MYAGKVRPKYSRHERHLNSIQSKAEESFSIPCCKRKTKQKAKLLIVNNLASCHWSIIVYVHVFSDIIQLYGFVLLFTLIYL